ncbi:related to short chain dehydrogenase/reductase [Ramularia collo-cygni]|uniref:Related to short chain dehydrogenase/reductase n=1 Tax=Ramularia collo-cygni TaxID=112498 RepID=A0A2D3VHD7_9PEZI|nr:related to short chain dehydrogenase/reductase [Ramularia collo-cygni]CZT22374.1 related to short chain dehydrogenase/reductase [Ramularia collo-cygni]
MGGFRSALTVLGGIFASYQVYRLLSFIRLYSRPGSLRRYKTDGKNEAPAWALVTGATDGIGRGFAEELCAQGFNVVIHGRNEKKLDVERNKLLDAWPGRQVRTLRIDAATAFDDEQIFDAAAASLNDINLKVVINNCGGAGGMLSFLKLQDRTSDDCRRFLDINARFPTEMTRVLLPQLLQQSPALIINIGSVTSDTGIPYLSVYSGCKAYNKAWSECLSNEMRAESKDIEALCVRISTVATDNVPRETSLFVPNARQIAQSSLNRVGCGKSVVYAYWAHALQAGMLDAMPKWLLNRTMISAAREEKVREEESVKSD